MKHAIVDLGSNTIRLSLYRVKPEGGFDLLFSQKQMAGLANYITEGVLSPDGIETACEALEHFQWILRHFEVDEIHVFATASLRNIRNTQEAVEGIRRATGLTAEVISGEEEARLGYYGALWNCDLESGVVFDIGGGSTEITLAHDGEILRAQSLPAGSLNLYNRYVSKFWPDKEELKELRRGAGRMLDLADLPARREACVCGVGGTARAMLKLANFHFQLPEDNRIITMAQMDELTQLLCQQKKPARKLVLRLCPDRVHTILPGAVLMNELCRRVCLEQIYISRYGVREGYLCRKL